MSTSEKCATVSAPRAMKYLHILLVEDDASSSLLVEEVMKPYGHSLRKVTTGKEGVREASSGVYQLILMDIHMPDIDGLQATRLIRENEDAEKRTPVPIIAFTAHAMRKFKEQCLSNGMNGYISKPIDIKKLAEIINTYAELRDGEHAL